MRLNGLQGLRYYVNNAVETCAYFAQLIRAHPCCKIVSHNYALVCFQYTVDNNDLISVSINYDRTSEANVDSSWLVMKSLIEEFRKRRDDPYLLLSTAPSNIDKRENSNFGRYMYDSVANTPEHSPTKNVSFSI
nr:unnamed protein product [Haemonchus contortus]